MAPIDPQPIAELATVVIPARDEATAIHRCLASVEAQGVDGLRVLVIDGNSRDQTVAVVERFASDSRLEIDIIANDQQTIPAALNLAARSVDTPFLVRMDAHACMAPGYLRAAVDALSSGSWAGVGGIKRPVGASRFGRAAAIAFATKLGSGGSYYHHGTERREVEHVPFGAYPTYVVRAQHGWDERLLVNQDYEFDHRVRSAGGRLLFEPAMRADWSSRNSMRELAYQYFRYGRGKAMVALKHPSSLRARQLAPPLLPVATIVAAVMSFVIGQPIAAIGIPAVHAVLVGLIGALESRRHPDATVGDLVLVPVAIWTMHWSWGLGVLRGLGGGWRRNDPFHGNPTLPPVDIEVERPAVDVGTPVP